MSRDPRFSDPRLHGARITVMGLGRFGGGIGVTRFLAARGARVLVTDQSTNEQLAGSVAQLADLLADGRVSLRLGGHDIADFTGCDGVVASPAVDPRHPMLAAARSAGVPVSSEIRLLCARLPERRRVIGLTGSAGKSTTTALVGAGLRAALAAAGDPARVWVGGNLGGSLLGEAGRIRPHDWVVLELSSFMLEGLDEDAFSPGIAVWTNLAPNHLDRHGSLEEYARVKSAIFRHQRPGDRLLTGPGLAAWTAGAPVAAEERVCSERDWAALGAAADDFRLPGAHNRQNAWLAAAALQAAVGLEPARALPHFAGFGGLPHRLAHVARVGGVDWFNDSKSTTPEATLLALAAFPPGSAHLIVGGRDKGADLGALCRGLAAGAAATYTVGEMGPAVAAGVRAAGGWAVECGTVAAAAAAARAAAQPGQRVVLSPAFASWDQFVNYEARGAAFIAAAGA